VTSVADERGGMRDELRGQPLTPIERQIGLRVASGRRRDEIAGEVGLDEATVAAHLLRTYRKTGARSSSELARRLAHPSTET